MTLEEVLKLENLRYVRQDGDEIEVTLTSDRGRPDRTFYFPSTRSDEALVKRYTQKHPQPLRSKPALKAPRPLGGRSADQDVSEVIDPSDVPRRPRRRRRKL